MASDENFTHIHRRNYRYGSQSENNSYVPFDFENLQAQIPELQQLDCTLEVQSYELSIDSSNATKDMVTVSQTIEQAYKYDGFVILHGSDTMAFISALSFMLESLTSQLFLQARNCLLVCPVPMPKKI